MTGRNPNKTNYSADKYLELENKTVKFLEEEYGKHAAAGAQAIAAIAPKYDLKRTNWNKDVVDCLTDALVAYQKEYHEKAQHVDPEKVKAFVLGEFAQRMGGPDKLVKAFNSGQGKQIIDQAAGLYHQKEMQSKYQVHFHNNTDDNELIHLADSYKAAYTDDADRPTANVVKELEQLVFSKADKRAKRE